MAKPEALPPIDITKLHPTDRGLMEYAGQFGFNPFMDLADFLEGKTVLDSGSGYDMLAIELALIDSTTRVVSVDPKRPVDLKNRLSEAKKRQVKLAEYLSAERDDKQLVALIKQVDANGLTGLAHEVDLPSNSLDVVFVCEFQYQISVGPEKLSGSLKEVVSIFQVVQNPDHDDKVGGGSGKLFRQIFGS